MLPLPLVVPQVALPEAAQVQVALVIAAGKVALTVTPLAVLGPLFDTAML
jgi:hypothetical protein